MSQAEYASKRLPVLTRLAMALRQIPAFEFAFAKVRALLRGRTSTEPVIASEFLPQASDATNDAATNDDAGADTIETDTLTGPPVRTDSVDADAAVTDTVVEIDTAEAATAPSDDVASREPEPDAVSEVDLVEAVALVPDPVGIEPVEVDADLADTVETEPVESLAAEIDTAEAATVPAADVVLAATKADDLSEREGLIRRRWKETGIRMWNGAGSVLCIQGRIELLPPKPGETMPQYDRLEFRLIEGNIVCEGFVVDPPEPRHRAFAEIGRG
jgi:hypothetical protein